MQDLREDEQMHDLREEMIRVCHLVYQKGWVAGSAGNLSIKLSPDQILCTPTGISKGFATADDLVICNLRGDKVDGHLECTSEIAMHLTIYELRPDIGAVVHAHPPVATGFAAAGRALDKALLPEIVVSLGAVPLAPYGLPGTPELGDGMKPFIPEYDAILLENHGCTAYGRNLREAFFRMETVEHLAQITLVAELLGGARPLNREQTTKLFAARRRYHAPDRNCMRPGMPVVAEED
jgi:L-fuculose-phosphate aldolase